MNSKPLTSFHIHQFRGIQDLELKDLGQFNLFVGVNNSGKTSVLEAISLYCNPLGLKEWYLISRLRDRESHLVYRLSMLESLKFLFPQPKLNSEINKENINIKISSSGEFSVHSLKASYDFIERIKPQQTTSNYGKEDEENELEELEEFDDLQTGILLEIKIISKEGSLELPTEIVENFELWKDDKPTNLNKSKYYKLQYTLITPYSHRSEAFAARLLTEAHLQGFKGELIKLLQILDHNIQDLIILTPDRGYERGYSVIYVDHYIAKSMPLSVFGDGVRRLVFIALQLIKLKDGILLIDEIETAIHTEALQDAFQWIVKWCKELNIQVFATTHSLEAVDAILSVTENDDDLVLYRLEPKDNKTSALRIGRDRLQRLRENLGREVRW